MAYNTSVFCIYRSAAFAETAVNHLIDAGFSNDSISVLLPNDRTEVVEDTVAGATAGGMIGGTLGILAGICMLAIPGLGPLIVAGPIVGALAGVGIGGTMGAMMGALVGMGIPEQEAKRYEARLKDGHVFLCAHCDTAERVSRAKEVLRDTGAEDISSTYAEDVFTRSAKTSALA
jgi:uncharacterized membrane protein